MSKLRFVLLLICVFMVYTQGLWERLFLLKSGTTILFEFPLWLYFFFSLKKFAKPTPARILIFVLIIVSASISFLNGSGIIELAKYLRVFIYAYLIYASLWNSFLTQSQWNRLLKFSVFLILLQGVGSAFNIFILGQRVEGHVGLMSSLGGTTATIFPLFVISIVSVAFIFSRAKSYKFNLLLILLVVSSVLVGYGSGKRAIFIAIPAYLFIAFVLSYIHLKGNMNFYKKIVWFIGLIIISVPAYFYGVTTSKGFNYGLSGGESNVEILSEVLNYTQQYESAESQYGETIGRSGTTLQVINNSFKSLNSFAFGYGFGAVKDETAQSSIGIGYGIVGFTRDIISGGWILMLLTVFIIAKMIFANASINFKFTVVLRYICLFVFVFSHFMYSSDFVVSLKVTFLMILLLVFVNSHNSQQYLQLFITQNFYSKLKK